MTLAFTYSRIQGTDVYSRRVGVIPTVSSFITGDGYPVITSTSDRVKATGYRFRLPEMSWYTIVLSIKSTPRKGRCWMAVTSNEIWESVPSGKGCGL